MGIQPEPLDLDPSQVARIVDGGPGGNIAPDASPEALMVLFAQLSALGPRISAMDAGQARASAAVARMGLTGQPVRLGSRTRSDGAHSTVLNPPTL